MLSNVLIGCSWSSLPGNHNADNIRQKSEALQSKMNELADAANARKGRLIDNSAFLQFIWKTDVVESWIADKETQVHSDDYGRDLSSVQTLLTKQETFDAGLQSFEKEGIQTITALKDQLVASQHAQTPAIEKRYNDVIGRCVSGTRSSPLLAVLWAAILPVVHAP